MIEAGGKQNLDEERNNGVPDAELEDMTDTVLSQLFGEETVEMARLIDASDLNMNDQVIKSISNGVNVLKQLKGRQEQQIRMLEKMEPGERLLVCLWIREMGLLEKITDL